MLIDSHCHLDHFHYKADLDEVIKRAKIAGIKFIITNGIDYETNLLSLKLGEQYPIVKVALGFYPQDALDREIYFETEKNKTKILEKSKKSIEDNLKLIKENKEKIIAIGEIGLDLYHGKNIEKQEKDLKKMIQLSIELDKPIILHTRKAEKETLQLLKEFNINPDKVILHCFSGNKKIIKEAIDSGYNFSIPTNIVRAENFQQLVEICPLNKILTETDGPYLSPFKNEDGSFNRNEPAYILESIKIIAKIKKLPEKEIEDQIADNFKRIFKL